MSSDLVAQLVSRHRCAERLYGSSTLRTLDNVGASVYGVGMNTHNVPRPITSPPVKRVPEWVKRAQAGQLVRKDYSGTVAA